MANYGDNTYGQGQYGGASGSTDVLIAGGRAVAIAAGRDGAAPSVPTARQPTVSLQIAPGAARFDLNPAWSEIGSLLRGFKINRGKQYETDQTQAGTASFVCRNETRALDPSYTQGPYYPNLVPGTQIYLRATFNGATYGLFRGFVERIHLRGDGPNYVETTFECSDRLTDFAQPTTTVTDTYPEQTTGARVQAILADANIPLFVAGAGWRLGAGRLGVDARLASTVSLQSLDTGTATVGTESVTAVNVLQYLNEIAQSEPGRIFVNGDGQFCFRDRTRYAPSNPAVISLTDQPSEIDSSHIPYQDFTPSDDIDRIKNNIQMTVLGGSVVTRVDAISSDTYGPRPFPFTTHLRPSDSDVQNQLGWWLFKLKDARFRVEQIVAKGYDTSSYNGLLPRELGDHVIVRRTPPGTPQETMAQDSTVEGLQIDGTPDGVWTWRLWTAPLPIVAGWQLGASALGTGSRLAFK